MEVIGLVTVFLFFLFVSKLTLKYLNLKKEGIQPSTNHSSGKSLLTSVFLSLFFILFILEMFAQVFSFNNPLLPQFISTPLFSSILLKIIGLVISFCAVYLLHLTLSSFKDSLRFGLDRENKGKLITTGVFSHTRNPFFLSIEMLFSGIGLIFGTWFFIGISVLAFVAIHFFILKEERFMRKNYGEEYDDYCGRVRRYF